MSRRASLHGGSLRITNHLFRGCHCHAAKENERAKREQNARHLPLIHITLSLRCGEQKRQNPPREALGDYDRNLAASVSVTRAG